MNSQSILDIYKVDDLLKMSEKDYEARTLNKKSIVSISSENRQSYKYSMARFTDLNKKLFVTKVDGSIMLYDIANDKELRSSRVHKDCILDIDLSPSHEIILTSSADGTSNVINPDDFRIISTIEPKNPTRNINSGKICPLFSFEDEDQAKYYAVIAGGQDAQKVTTTHKEEGGFELIFYNLMHGEEMGCLEKIHFGPVNAVAFSGNGKAVASGGEDTSVKLHHIPDDLFSFK